VREDNRVSLRLYDYAASANCYKVRLLLAQLGRDYERVPVDIFAGETLTDEFVAMNVARRTPVLERAPGDFLPESNAILLHLAEGTPFLSADRSARAHVYRWLFFEQSFFEPTGRWRSLLEAHRPRRVRPGSVRGDARASGRCDADVGEAPRRA